MRKGIFFLSSLSSKRQKKALCSPGTIIDDCWLPCALECNTCDLSSARLGIAVVVAVSGEVKSTAATGSPWAEAPVANAKSANAAM